MWTVIVIKIIVIRKSPEEPQRIKGYLVLLNESFQWGFLGFFFEKLSPGVGEIVFFFDT